MAYADFEGKIILHSWGRFRIALAADCKGGDLLTMTGALADGDSVAAHCIACQDGSLGDVIWAALAVEVKKPPTIGVGGVVTPGNHGGVADDVLYLSATAGKLGVVATLAVKQICGLCLDTERVIITPSRVAFVATAAHLVAASADAGLVATDDLVDDGGAYSAAWTDTVVTMCNEIKADYNAAVTLINELKADLNAITVILEDLGLMKTV